jgi:hypothetical protein
MMPVSVLIDAFGRGSVESGNHRPEGLGIPPGTPVFLSNMIRTWV